MRSGTSLLLGLSLVYVWGLSGCAGTPTRYPGYPLGYVERGEASWYGPHNPAGIPDT